MKLIFNTSDLINKVKNIAPTAEAKQTLMILGNMVFRIENGVANISASDLEIEVSTEVKCESEIDCEFTIPARKLLEVLNALSDHKQITINVSDSKADITAGKSKISLPTLPVDDYPSTSFDIEAQQHKIDEDDLIRIISKTSFAMAYQDARHFLNGLYLCSDEGKLVSVCTDGHRLAKYTSMTEASGDISLIIPRKAILEINRILQSFTGDSGVLVEYSYNKANFSLNINDYKLSTKLIEGNYPNFNKVIPASTESEIIVDKKLFKNSLNIISKVVNQQYKGVKLTPQSNTMHLISSNTDSEVGEDQIDVEYSGSEMSIGFNISYLQDVIDVIDGETVHICINDQNSGCVVKGSGDTNSLFVIMPMRV